MTSKIWVLALIVVAAVATSCTEDVETLVGSVRGQIPLDDGGTLSALQVPIDLSGDVTDGCASLSAAPELGAAPQACVGALERTGLARGEPMGIIDFEPDGDVLLVAAVVWQGTSADIDCGLGSRVVPLVGVEPGMALLVGAIDAADCPDDASLTVEYNGRTATIPLPDKD